MRRCRTVVTSASIRGVYVQQLQGEPNYKRITFVYWPIFTHKLNELLLVLSPNIDSASSFDLGICTQASEPGADDVIESGLGSSRMLTHHAGPLMSSVAPFVCGPPLCLWLPLHFLLQTRRVFVAWWFQGFRALCPYSTVLREWRGRGCADRPTARRRLIDRDNLGEKRHKLLRGISTVEVSRWVNPFN